MDAQQYRALVETRMREAGYEVQTTPAGLIGYRKQFKLTWMATTLHLFVHVATTSTVGAGELDAFVRQSLEHAKASKGSLRGFQSGVATITAVVGDGAEAPAVEYARNEIVRGYAAFAWPVVVDLGARRRVAHEGRVAIGGVYSSYMRSQIDAVLPDPATL